MAFHILKYFWYKVFLLIWAEFAGKSDAHISGSECISEYFFQVSLLVIFYFVKKSHLQNLRRSIPACLVCINLQIWGLGHVSILLLVPQRILQINTILSKHEVVPPYVRYPIFFLNASTNIVTFPLQDRFATATEHIVWRRSFNPS